jgi:hypothetical protein
MRFSIVIVFASIVTGTVLGCSQRSGPGGFSSDAGNAADAAVAADAAPSRDDAGPLPTCTLVSEWGIGPWTSEPGVVRRTQLVDGNPVSGETRDGDGRLLSTSTSTRSGNRVTEAWDNDGDGVVDRRQTVEHVYDALERRIALRIDDDADGIVDYHHAYRYAGETRAIAGSSYEHRAPDGTVLASAEGTWETDESDRPTRIVERRADGSTAVTLYTYEQPATWLAGQSDFDEGSDGTVDARFRWRFEDDVCAEGPRAQDILI